MPEEKKTADATDAEDAKKAIGIADVWKAIGGFDVVAPKDASEPPHAEHNPAVKRRGKQSDILSWKVNGKTVTVVTTDGRKIKGTLR